MNADERQRMIDQYRDGIAEVDKALAGATAEELDRRPAPNEWTAREVAHHLADSETMSTIRLRRLLDAVRIDRTITLEPADSVRHRGE